MATVIEIPKKASKKKVKEILGKVESLKKGKMVKHFGALKRGIDGLAYQKKVTSAQPHRLMSALMRFGLRLPARRLPMTT